VLTANHYWLDAVGALFLFGGALWFDRWRERRVRQRQLLDADSFDRMSSGMAVESCVPGTTDT
jgi:hypothetical protein